MKNTFSRIIEYGFKCLVFCIFTFVGHAQSTVEFYYDNAGNRILRQVYVMKSNSNENNYDSESDTLSDTTGIHEFVLFPNPTRDVLQISASNSFLDLSNKMVRVYDLTGKELINESVVGQVTILDFSKFITGVYIVRMLADGQQVREWKVIRE